MADYTKTLYGDTLYGERGETTDPAGQYVDLLPYLPPYWRPITEMVELQKSLGSEAGLLRRKGEDLQRQLYLNTADGSLKLWEKDYGVVSDANKSNEFRRERVRAKKRGGGATTKQQIVSVASAFAGGEAEVIEWPADNRFTIKFVGLKGVPGNMADLSATIEEIKPAHLAYDYEYTYNWWDAVKDKTWEGCAPLTWEQLKTV